MLIEITSLPNPIILTLAFEFMKIAHHKIDFYTQLYAHDCFEVIQENMCLSDAVCSEMFTIER